MQSDGLNLKSISEQKCIFIMNPKPVAELFFEQFHKQITYGPNISLYHFQIEAPPLPLPLQLQLTAPSNTSHWKSILNFLFGLMFPLAPPTSTSRVYLIKPKHIKEGTNNNNSLVFLLLFHYWQHYVCVI